MCFCGKCEGMCRLTWVVYKLKCRKCKQTYIGKTRRELRVRVSEHIRAVEGRGGHSALCRHPCREGYEIRIYARTQNNPAALRNMERKMMNKYCPKINIKQENHAREKARTIATALKKRMGPHKPAVQLRLPKGDPDHEDGADEFWMEDSEWLSTELFIENENGDSQNSEPNRSYGSNKCNIVHWNAQNYALLKAAKVLTVKNPFEYAFIHLHAEEAIDHMIHKKEHAFWKALWHATPIGVWFDNEKTVVEKFATFGLEVALTAIPWAVGALWVEHVSKAVRVAEKVAAHSIKAAKKAESLRFAAVKLKVTSSTISSAYALQGMTEGSPVILLKKE